MKKLILAAAAVLSLAAGATAHAATALTPTVTTGSQAWTGALGMDFDVLSPISVTHLGSFDSGLDGFTNAIQVGIFDRTSGLLVGNSASITTSDALDGANRFFDVADFTLGIGQYSIVAVGYGPSDLNGNQGTRGFTDPSTIDTGGGLISFVGLARFNDAANTSFALPSIIDGGPANRYDAGTFQFVAAPVPEPETYAMMLAGLGALGFMARRRRQGK